jgi:hypothetical protein
MQGISWLAEDLHASQEGLFFMEWLTLNMCQKKIIGARIVRIPK